METSRLSGSILWGGFWRLQKGSVEIGTSDHGAGYGRLGRALPARRRRRIKAAPARAVRAGRNGDLRGDLLVERASGSGRGGIRQNPRTGTKTPELGRKEADARIGRRHAVALADLDPGSTYYYCVEGVGRATASGFRSAPWARTPAFPSPWSATGQRGLASIHRSAWNRNSRKSICRIVHRSPSWRREYGF